MFYYIHTCLLYLCENLENLEFEKKTSNSTYVVTLSTAWGSITWARGIGHSWTLNLEFR